MAFPTTLTNAVDGVTDALASQLNAVEAKLGIDSSAITTSHDYKLSSVTSTAKAVSTASAQDVAGVKTFTDGIKTDTVDEETAAAGVIVDGVLLKDSQVTTDIVNEKTAGAGVTLDSFKVKDGDIVDTNGNELLQFTTTASAINELTLVNGAAGGAPALAATGGDTNINIILTGKGTGGVVPNILAPRGFLVNGKISPAVSSNNLTVALKTLAGNDPSSTDPVYIRIGDTIRSVTGALSVTLAAGTNWFNSGSAALASVQVDYFVYMGYNATDGVTLGFARIPYGKIYSEFSTTSTSDKYLGLSNRTTAAATDDYEVVGRFTALLTVTPNFYWSVPTFDGYTLVQRPVYETRWLTWTPTYTASGSMTYTSVTTQQARYRLSGNTCTFTAGAYGTTGGTASFALEFTSPITVGSAVTTDVTGPAYLADGADRGGYIFYYYTTNTISARKYDTSNFGLGTNRYVRCTLSYEI